MKEINGNIVFFILVLIILKLSQLYFEFCEINPTEIMKKGIESAKTAFPSINIIIIAIIASEIPRMKIKSDNFFSFRLSRLELYLLKSLNISIVLPRQIYVHELE